jgi:hypothetical protein
LPESLPKSLNDKGKHPTVEKAVDYESNKKKKVINYSCCEFLQKWNLGFHGKTESCK